MTYQSNAPLVVAALYRFTALPDCAAMREPLLDLLLAQAVRGTLLLAPEGINGTIAGTRTGINAVLEFLQRDPRLTKLEVTESQASTNPFLRSKVKLKKEIVTMGVPGIDPRHHAGTYVEPKDWNALISDPEVLVLDTRNNYEVHIGSFDGAVNPHTETFRQFPDYVATQLHPQRHKKIAMFCTGGIRCEKSTAYLKQQGFAEVYQLKGGILNYLQQIPATESTWHGECFVFDDRVTVTHQLTPGSYAQCHACRMPLSAAEQASEHYRQGLSCPHCYQRQPLSKQQSLAERHRQIQLARDRGESHLGHATRPLHATRRQHKQQQANN